MDIIVGKRQAPGNTQALPVAAAATRTVSTFAKDGLRRRGGRSVYSWSRLLGNQRSVAIVSGIRSEVVKWQKP